MPLRGACSLARTTGHTNAFARHAPQLDRTPTGRPLPRDLLRSQSPKRLHVNGDEDEDADVGFMQPNPSNQHPRAGRQHNR